MFTIWIIIIIIIIIKYFEICTVYDIAFVWNLLRNAYLTKCYITYIWVALRKSFHRLFAALSYIHFLPSCSLTHKRYTHTWTVLICIKSYIKKIGKECFLRTIISINFCCFFLWNVEMHNFRSGYFCWNNFHTFKTYLIKDHLFHWGWFYTGKNCRYV